MPQTRVLIADSHPIIGQGLSTLLSDTADIVVAATARTVEMAEALVEELAPDVLILDEDLGPAKCARLVERIRQRSAPPSVVLLSPDESSELAQQAVELGVSSYVLREASLEDLVAAVRSAHLGDLWLSSATVTTLMDAMQIHRTLVHETPLRALTQREEQILELLVGGLGHKAIAEHLNLSLNTVRTHTRNIQMKLDVHSNVEAVSVALGRGIRPS